MCCQLWRNQCRDQYVKNCNYFHSGEPWILIVHDSCQWARQLHHAFIRLFHWRRTVNWWGGQESGCYESREYHIWYQVCRLRIAVVDPQAEDRADSARRLIGRRFDDPTVKKDIETWPFKVVDQGGNPVVQVEYLKETKTFSPQEISSMVLMKVP